MKGAENQDWCDFCDGKVLNRTVRARFHFRGQTIFVDRVPAWVCNRCGVQYFEASVYKRLEAIARHRRRIKRTVSFPLARYDMAIA